MKDVEFGDRLKQLLEENNMTQLKLADELNLVPSTLNGYIKKSRMPEYTTLIKLSRLFNTTCDYLIGNSVYKSMDDERIIDADENRLLELYRKLDEDHKAHVIDYLVLLGKRFDS